MTTPSNTDSADRLTNALCRELGIRDPIFGLAHSVEVAAAISNAGGFGVYGAARDGPNELEGKLRELRRLCPDKPVGVDLMLPAGIPESATAEQIQSTLPDAHRRFVDRLFEKYSVPPATHGNFFSSYVRSKTLFNEQVDAVLASGVQMFAAGVGTPPDVLKRARAAGLHTLALIGNTRHAEKAIEAGVQTLVAQGYDAGGHTGPIGTFTLLPQIIEIAGGRPVLAAGGIGAGSQIAGALAMGAQGAWLGTVWMATVEHKLPASLVNKLIRAGSLDTVITRAHSGKPCRVVRSAFSDEWDAAGAPEPLGMPYQQALTGKLLAAVEEHDVEPLIYEAAGQSVAWIRQLESVADVVARLRAETCVALDQLRAYYR